jgi:hypothetical protein
MFTRPGGNPTAVPELTPRFPVTMDGPELVTVLPSTAKLAAERSGGVGHDPVGMARSPAGIPAIARNHTPRLSLE